MGRSKKPPERCLFVNVFHPDAFDREIAEDEYEDPGTMSILGPMSWGVYAGDKSPRLLRVEIKHGMARHTAARLLRRIAEAIEQSPEKLMAAPEWTHGHYDLENRAFIDEWAGMGSGDGEAPEVL
jgi:hypothetical protein